MNPLNNEQKELLFNYCIGLISQEHSTEAKSLISSNEEAAQIYSKMKTTLSPLDFVEFESCPDDLVERTILGVNNIANSGHQHLEQLLKAEQTKEAPIKIGSLRNFVEIAAVAAAVMLIAGVLVPTMGYARQKYWLQQCQTNLGSIFQGYSNYMADHDGKQPTVLTAKDSQWWMVGYQGQENHSNTRNIFLLVKNGYVNPKVFVCSSRKNRDKLQIDPSKIKTLKDFPDRRYVTYSFQVRCSKSGSSRLSCRKVIMADRNPLFEELPDDYSESLLLELTKELLVVNSMNHNRRGQNVLFGDGRVEYRKSRLINTDDIFTLQDTDTYQGSEVPSCETDAFLAP
jgi:hypothetical protein